jgi:hypothetical protein
MTKVSFEVWIEAVKDRCRELELDYDDLADFYPFQTAYDYDLRPNETVEDAAVTVPRIFSMLNEGKNE